MATYREIHGKAIKSLDTDPALAVDAGQIWYNTASDTFKSIINLKAWVSGTPTSNTYDQNGGCGTQTAALTGAGSNKTSMEEYNGLGWVSGGAVPAAQELQSQLAGTQTAAIMKSGLHQNPDRYNTEAYTYNGTSWSSIPAAPGNRVRGAAVGTTTAFLCAGGASGPPTFTNRLSTSVEYNGSSWTAGGALSTARAYLAGLGTEPAAIMAGGAVPPSYSGTNVTEQYDGSSFSSLPNLNTARHGLSAAGTTTSNIVFGGGAGPPFENKTESYDGSAWTVQPTMGTGRTYLGGAGADSTAAVAMAGTTGSATALVEEFNNSTNVITAGAWASGTAYPSNAVTVAGTGTQTAAIGFGGYDPGGNLATSYKYDGSSWTSGGSLSEARQGMGSAGAAPQTTALAFGGYNTPGPPYARAVTDEYDGSSWTASNNMNTARDNSSGTGIGTQTAAIAAGGGGGLTSVESYNGSSWTALPALPAGKKQGGSLGISTAGAVFGGFSPAPAVVATQLDYNGSAWTAGASLNQGRYGLGGAGTTTSGLAFKGQISHPGGETTQTEQYNGTSWASAPSTSTALYYVGAAGVNVPSSGALSISGRTTPAYSNAVEEYTAETSTINVKTLTQS